jgi:hypothetical protein
MACIQREAAEAAITYLDETPNQAKFKESFYELPQLIATADAAAKPGYQKAFDVGRNGAMELDNAMSTVNTNVIKQSLNASVRPDIQKISNELRQAASQATTNTTNASNTKAFMNTRRGLIPPLEVIQIKNMVDFAAEFDKNITTCTAIAGT